MQGFGSALNESFAKSSSARAVCKGATQRMC